MRALQSTLAVLHAAGGAGAPARASLWSARGPRPSHGGRGPTRPAPRILHEATHRDLGWVDHRYHARWPGARHDEWVFHLRGSPWHVRCRAVTRRSRLFLVSQSHLLFSLRYFLPSPPPSPSPSTSRRRFVADGRLRRSLPIDGAAAVPVRGPPRRILHSPPPGPLPRSPRFYPWRRSRPRRRRRPPRGRPVDSPPPLSPGSRLGGGGAGGGGRFARGWGCRATRCGRSAEGGHAPRP